MKVVVNSLFLEEELKTVKLASLYCDSIILSDGGGGHVGEVWDDSGGALDPSTISAGVNVRFKFGAHWKTLPDRIKNELSPLIQEGILNISEEEEERALEQFFMQTFVDIQDQLFFVDSDGRLVNRLDEIGIVGLGMSPCVEVFKENIKEEWGGIWGILRAYFAHLAKVNMSASLRFNAPIITDSLVVNGLLLNYLKAERLIGRYNVPKQKAVSLSQRVLGELLPNIKDAPIDDILEIRHKMRGELEAFRVAMSKFTSDINSNPWDKDIENEINKIVETKIKPSVLELKNSLTHSNQKSIQRVFENLKDPATYVPLVGTVVSDIRPSIALLASLGLAGFKAVYDTMIESRVAKDANGLILLLKAPMKLKKRKADE